VDKKDSVQSDKKEKISGLDIVRAATTIIVFGIPLFVSVVTLCGYCIKKITNLKK